MKRPLKHIVTEPPKAELIGYARVSTEDQNLAMQVEALRKAGCLNVYEEKISGASKKRPQLDLAIKDLRPTDTLVVWRLDRLARSMRELYRRLDQINEAGATFKSLTEHFDFGTATGHLILGIAGVFAEFERQLTIERTRAGIAAAQARGFKFGAKVKFTPAKKARARAWIKKGVQRVIVAKRLGLSAQTIHVWYRGGMKVPSN